MAILAVNAGSSSLKFSVHPIQAQTVGSASLTGLIEGLEPGGQARLRWQRPDTQGGFDLPSGTDAASPFALALSTLQQWLSGQSDLPPIQAVAHRVVHGGQRYTHSVRISPEVMHELARLDSLAPLHQPHNRAGILAFGQAYPALPQFACFDTAFHAAQDPIERRFALPESLHQAGVMRYGFHGLSYQYILQTLHACSTRAQGRVLMAHLGNGASLCGAQDGRSRTSTMGFSALDGLMMGTRSGALDPGVLLYLLEQGWDHARIERLLYKQSGLLGVSGLSADMRRLRASPDTAAHTAIELFTRRVVRESAAVAGVLQGLDLIAFSGGIGEHDSALRQTVCERLAWMGVRVDAELNQAATGRRAMAIHATDSPIEVWVIPTDEGRIAAQEAWALLCAEQGA